MVLRILLVFTAVVILACDGDSTTDSGEQETPPPTENGAASPTTNPTVNPDGAIVVTPRSSISAAVEAAPEGARILVEPGVYHEQVDITKPLTLEGRPGAVIDGECSRDFGVRILQVRDLDTGQPTVNPSNVTVRGFTIRNVIFATVWIFQDEDLPQTAAPHDITIDGNTLTDFNCTNIQDSSEKLRAGVGVHFGGSNMRVTNNTIKYRGDLPDDDSDQRSYSNGIWFASRTMNPSGGGHYIAHNRIVGGYDGIGGEVEEDPHGSFDRDTIIEFNTVMNGQDDGIQVEGGDQDVIVRNNEITLFATGIAFASPHSGPLYIEDNTISSPRRGPQGNLFCFKVGRADGSGEVPLSHAKTIVTGNTCTADGAEAMDGVKQTDETLAPIEFRDNCVIVSRYVYEITYGPTDGLEFDGNIVWTTDPERFIKWGSQTSLYGSLEAFQQATGQEANGEARPSCD